MGKRILAAALVLAPGAALANQPNEIIVTASPGLPGLSVDPDRLPTASESLGAAALGAGSTSLLRGLDARAAGVTLDQAQDNPFQPNLLFRGYEASPLGGNAQGLAVYVDGARFNQPFGDTMNWDLLPDNAVQRISLAGANPVYGLNALGGAISIDLKTGRAFRGVGGETSIGRFGRRAITGEGGLETRSGLSAYVAASIQHDDGWREHSPSTVKSLYGQLGLDGTWGNIDLRLMGANTSLTGNGTSPVELLKADYAAVFTYPDQTNNRFARAVLSGDLELGDHLQLKPAVYLSHLRQRTANGDLSDAEPCDGNAAILCLEGDVGSVVTDKSGTPFGSFIRHDTYAQLNATRSVTTGYGASIELLDNARIGRFENHLALGVSWDGSRSRFSAESEIGALTEDRGFGDPHGIIDMADGPIRSVDVVSHRSDLGIFVSDMFSPTSRLDVTVSARYNRSRVRLADQIGEDLNGDHVYQRLNPAVGASWHIARGVSLYGGYSESNRAPTPAELSCANPEAPCSLSAFFVNDPDLDPVVAHTWEAGVRGREDLGRGISIAWRVGGWRSTNSNDIIFTASQAVGRAYFRNVGETRRQGIEAEAQVEAKRWSARISYVLTDATYRTAFAANSPDNPGADDGGLIDVLPGDRIPGIPRHRLKASVTRKLGEVAWVALDGQYSGRRWLLGDEANLTFPTKGYFLANLSAGIRPFKGIELFGEIDNLANRKYATFGGFTQTDEVNFQEAPGIANSRALAPGAPRTWVFGARASF